jgi:hypothetical protein
MMSLDDGPADREADPHTVVLRCVEGIEQLVYVVGGDAHPRIPHAHPHTIPVVPFGSDQQLPRAIVHVNHGVAGVAEQVQDDLLELDSIAGDGREILGELRLKSDAVSLKVTQRQRHDVADREAAEKLGGIVTKSTTGSVDRIHGQKDLPKSDGLAPRAI